MEPEFSRPVDVARLGAATATYNLAAKPEERAALAKRFGLVSLDRLEAKIELKRIPGGMVRLDAAMRADLVQSCVVTLDPVPAAIEEEFTLLYGDVEEDNAALDPDAEPVEPIEDGRIDLGEAVAQQLSLSLDPYPRSPAALAEAPPADTKDSPFAALAKLRQMK